MPVVIEVNAHDCLYHVTVQERMQAGLRGRAVGALVRNMLHRSQRYLLAGKTALVVGAGGFSKRHLWRDARDFGVKVGWPALFYLPPQSHPPSPPTTTTLLPCVRCRQIQQEADLERRSGLRGQGRLARFTYPRSSSPPPPPPPPLYHHHPSPMCTM